MSKNEHGRWYRGWERCERASLPVTYVSADATFPFDPQDAEVILADVRMHEFLETALTGANNDLVWIARQPDTSAVTVAYVDPALASQALSIEVTGDDIVVNLATNGALAITSTAAQIMALANATKEVTDLVTVQLAPGSTGVGVVIALAATGLGVPQGTTPTLDITLDGSPDDSVWTAMATFTQKAATIVASEKKHAAGFPPYCRWNLNRGADADERIAISIVSQAKSAR